MTPAELEKRRERAETETLVITTADDGFRVYAPEKPQAIYLVSGTPEAPTCTCRDFRFHQEDPAWRCKHILAVLRRGAPDDPETAEERRAIREEGSLADAGGFPPAANGPSQMVLKRSVSPDGRIDSLSVELTCPVQGASRDEVCGRAEDALALQSAIVDRFLGQRSDGTRAEHSSRAPDNGAQAAKLLDVAAMNTRFGRRLFLNVQVNGETLKLFGSAQHLADAVANAGFPDHAQRIQEGARLDLPCRVTTKKSDDGRYTNVDEVLPATESPRRPQRGWR